MWYSTQTFLAPFLAVCRASTLEEAWRLSSLWQGASPAKTRASSMPSCAQGPHPRCSMRRESLSLNAPCPSPAYLSPKLREPLKGGLWEGSLSTKTRKPCPHTGRQAREKSGAARWTAGREGEAPSGDG